MTIYKIANLIDGKYDYVDGTEEEANAKLLENQTDFLTQEAYRFSISQVTVNGNNTLWSAANLVDGDEEGDYRVFNQTTGQYESLGTLTEAKYRTEEFKKELLSAVNLNRWEIVDFVPIN